MQRNSNSVKILKRAKKLIPGLSQTFSKAPYSYVEGVYPNYLSRGKGSHVFDVDNNEYIDYVLGLGPITLGYNYPRVNKAITDQLKNGISFSIPHKLEVEVSEKLCSIIPGAEMVRFAKT
ncbi:MAG: aminotransferase class III-fold pyridoxal phosphate-dependent enzyme, partial [Nitrosarchaeum sp.]|nr:aminotransferase class III-fold pyridoxal phosphate-dependent enzyme [Nitrosarchaeum sp.]